MLGGSELQETLRGPRELRPMGFLGLGRAHDGLTGFLAAAEAAPGMPPDAAGPHGGGLPRDSGGHF